MDPQSLSFTPQSQNEYWRLSNTIRSFQEIQQEHADRLIRLERRQDEDARVKSVWGPSSPFPGILSGTPNPGLGRQTSSVDFNNFDEDQSNSMIRSLHLDAEDEPRRFGAGSRTNSVRFDDSANQGQWAHASRTSIDLLPRATSSLSGLGGHPMFERSASHKSDGRHSSAGQSAVSGRANSLGIDTSHPLAQSPMEPPGLAPGLFLLGAVPSIIRCWLSTSFNSESLLYAAVCTGSYKSFLDVRLIKTLGFSERVRDSDNGDLRIRLPVYLPEAVPQYSSSRSSSPVPPLPTLSVDFTVIEPSSEQTSSKAVQIFLGSDMLRAHNADILFSSNTMTLFDDDRSKLSIPLVRPEDQRTFTALAITSCGVPVSKSRTAEETGLVGKSPSELDLAANGTVVQPLQGLAKPPDPEISMPTEEKQPVIEDEDERDLKRTESEQATLDSPSVPPASNENKPLLANLNTTKAEAKENSDESPPLTATSRTTSSPAIWSNWRRDGTGTGPANDWANVSRNSSGTYNRPNREQGIKVLKPTRQTSRPTNPPFSPSPSSGQSRFFDDGKRRGGSGTPGAETGDAQQALRRTASGEGGKASGKESSSSSAVTAGNKSRSTNPIGGASAFGWLNSADRK